MKTSHAVKPANIRVINRRRTGPISGYALEQKLTASALYNEAWESIFLLTTVSHIRLSLYGMFTLWRGVVKSQRLVAGSSLMLL